MRSVFLLLLYLSITSLSFSNGDPDTNGNPDDDCGCIFPFKNECFNICATGSILAASPEELVKHLGISEEMADKIVDAHKDKENFLATDLEQYLSKDEYLLFYNQATNYSEETYNYFKSKDFPQAFNLPKGMFWSSSVEFNKGALAIIASSPTDKLVEDFGLSIKMVEESKRTIDQNYSVQAFSDLAQFVNKKEFNNAAEELYNIDKLKLESVGITEEFVKEFANSQEIIQSVEMNF